MEKEIQWSKQQKEFLDWCVNGKGSCCLIAVAGAGKSTTVVEGAFIMPGQTAIMAYNRSAGIDLKAKIDERNKKESVPLDWRKLQAGTAHSFGFAAYRKAFPNVKVDGDKVSRMLDDIIEAAKDNRDPFNKRNLTLSNVEARRIEENYSRHFSKIRALVSHAKQQAFGVLTIINDDQPWLKVIERFDILDEEDGSGIDPLWLIDAARNLLLASNKRTDWIDFDDQIYLPLLLKLRFWRFDNVIMDEAQDTNPARRALIRAMLKPGGRVIAVGDPCQAIYAYAGADSNSIELIKKDFSAKEMPLTVSYRCPQTVVKFAHQWVDHIEAHPTAPEGVVKECDEANFFLQAAADTFSTAVLCRLTKPLVQLAFALIRRKIPCKVEGREIGEQIKKLVNRWKVKDTEALSQKLNAYLEAETTKLLAKKQEQKAAIVEDMVETIRVIIDQCNREKKHGISDVTQYIDNLFDDNIVGMLTLSTIHKSKGREWQTVYWLNRVGTCPSPWARQEWQQEQEDNLCYVAATRAKSTLVDLTVPFEKKEKRAA